MQRGITVAGLNAYEDSDQYVAPPEPPAHLADLDAAGGLAPSAANGTAADGGGGGGDGSGDGGSGGSNDGVRARRVLLAGDADASRRGAVPSGTLSVLGGALDTVRSWTPEARRQAAAAQERVRT